MRFPSCEEVQRIREQYPVGSTVELIHMDDPHNRSLVPGSIGRITHIDDVGTVFVTWQNGSGLGLIVGVDEFRIIQKAGADDE